MAMLHIYAGLVAAGEPAEQRYPSVAAHLRACGPCGEDSTSYWLRFAARRTDGQAGNGPAGLRGGRRRGLNPHGRYEVITWHRGELWPAAKVRLTASPVANRP
jgi:hypothetical protein